MIKVPKRLKTGGHRYCIFIVVLLASVFSIKTAKAQQVIATGGNHHKSGDISISWTLGEPVIKTFRGNENILTQGFQQPKLTIVSVDEIDAPGYEISVFPNPTSSNVTLNLETDNFGNISFRINDLNGGLIKENSIDSKNTTVSFEGLKPGVYFISIIEKNKKLTTVKIIKN